MNIHLHYMHTCPCKNKTPASASVGCVAAQVFDFGGAEAVIPSHSTASHTDKLLIQTVSGHGLVEAYPDGWPGHNVVYLGDR